MDISCSFQIRGIEGTSSRALKQLTVRSRLDYKLFSNTRLVLRVGPRKKLKLIASSCSVVNSSKITGCELKSCLWSYSKPKCTVCLLKTSRGVKVTCQGNDSIAYIDGNGRDVDFVDSSSGETASGETNLDPEKINGSSDKGDEEEVENPSLDEWKKVLQKALKELEIAQLNSTMFEEKAQRISEAAIALKDEASNAQSNVDLTLTAIEKIENEEIEPKEAVQRAKMALSLSEAKLSVAVDSLKVAKERKFSPEIEDEKLNSVGEEEDAVFVAQEDTRECHLTLANCQGALTQLQNKKDVLKREVNILKDIAQKAQMDALRAEEEVANIMLLAEEAVAFELETTKRVNDAEIALQKAEKMLSVSYVDNSETSVSQNVLSSSEGSISEDKGIQENSAEMSTEGSLIGEDVPESQTFEESRFSDDSDQDNGKPSLSSKETEYDAEKVKNQTKKPDTQKDLTKDSSPLNSSKTSLKKSSRFFPASFFSSAEDDTEFTPSSFFQWLIDSSRMQIPKLVLGSLLVGAGYNFFIFQLFKRQNKNKVKYTLIKY